VTHSIVVPLYNKADYIAETIASLAGQALAPQELIVVDDASTDESLTRLRASLTEYSAAFANTRVEIIALQENRGPGHARNLGLAAARGDLISFLDADDSYRPDAISRIGEGMRTHRLDIAAIGFGSDPPGECFPQRARLDGELMDLESDLWLLATPLHTVSGADFFMGRASNVVVRRSWLASERYDTGARLNEGIDFWYRVLKHILVQSHVAGKNARIGLFAAPLIRFRLLPDSLSHRPCWDWRMLALPPSVARFLDSEEAHDQRLVHTLATRWVEHAMSALGDGAQRAAFLHQHGALLARIGVEPSLIESAIC
jgi:glycosyltransferase involved in cell wall biosynthesis